MINISDIQMNELKRVKRSYQVYLETDNVSQAEFVMLAVKVLEYRLRDKGVKL